MDCHRWLWVTAVAALLTSGPGLGAIVDPEGRSPSLVWAELDPAMQDTLEAIADQRGISREEARQRIGWQNDFASAATAIQETFPEAFSRSEITSELPAKAIIYFKGPVPNGAAALLKTVPQEVEVALEGGRPYTADEISDRVARAHKASIATGLIEEASAQFDYDAGRVQIVGRPSASAISPTDREKDRQRIQVALMEKGLEVSVDLLDTARSGTDTNRYGGGWLPVPSTAPPRGYCSGAFNVRSISTGVTGVLSAGHCANSLMHTNGRGLVEYPMTFRNEHMGAWGDFGWYTTTQPEPARFYSDYGTLVNVTTRGNPTSGQTICRFGHSNGRKCDTVDELDTCYDTNAWPQMCKVVMMNHDYALGGDSGGPWYVGTVAYGVHSGYKPCGFLWGSTCDVWSRVYHTDEALGLAILTQ